MGTLVKIGRFFYRFRSIEGRQFVNGKQYASIRDDESHTITIADGAPLEHQLAAAAREAVSALEDQGALKEPEQLRTIEHLGIPSLGKVNARS